MENALELQGVTKRYQDFTLDGIELNLPQGCILGLIGENGAGKSTTIKAIIGAVHPDEGQIRVLGCDNRAAAFTEVKNEIGVVLDEACFPGGLTPRQVNHMMKNVYNSWEEDTYWGYLKKFNLPEKKQFRDFSKGMKMKLSLAVALSHQAKLLILDEATSGLDPIVRDEILDIFYEFTRQEDHAILMSSHIVSDLEKVCDYIAFIHKGKLLFCEEKDRLLEEYGLLSLSRADFDTLAPEAVVSARSTGYSVEALVRRELVPAGLQVKKAGIENIIVALAKEEQA